MNVEIEAIAAANENVVLVDQFTGFDTATQTYDQLHPNESGEQHMAARWLAAIQSVECDKLLGDFNDDGAVNVEDIDLLSGAMQGNDTSQMFDLNGDSVIDEDDLTVLTEDILGIRRGDSNLDGVVQFSDFLTLSRNFGQSAGWSSGDFDGDGQVGFLDFLALSRSFGLPPLT